jgi:hypothetical protein
MGPLVKHSAAKIPIVVGEAFKVLEAYQELLPHLGGDLLEKWQTAGGKLCKRSADDFWVKPAAGNKAHDKVTLSSGVKLPGKHRRQVLVNFYNGYYKIGKKQP